LLVTVNSRLKFEIEIIHDLSCHLHMIHALQHTIEADWQQRTWSTRKYSDNANLCQCYWPTVHT